MGQIPKRAPKVPLSFRAVPDQVAALDQVVAAEGSEDVGRSEVIEYMIGLALPLYWAREDVGHERIDRAIEEYGGDARKAYADLLMRGLVARQLDPALLKAAIAERNRRVPASTPVVVLVESEADADRVERAIQEMRRAHVAGNLSWEEIFQRMASETFGTENTTGPGLRRNSQQENVRGSEKEERMNAKKLVARARELRVLGHPDADIAKALGMSESRVRELLKDKYRLKPTR